LTRSDTEVILIEGLQQGDLTALPEIMQLYQKQALSWAMQIVHDSYLAEDVVQEAFYQMQQKITSLKESGKFRPWFRQMVRRLAINQIRGAHNKETLHEEISEVDPADAEWGHKAAGPLEEVLQQQNIKQLLAHTLSIPSEQARSVLQAFAMENYEPDELSLRFQTPKSNIYNILSRSRVKAADERFRYEMNHYLAERRQQGLHKNATLEPPAFSSPYSLMTVALKEVLAYAHSDGWSITDLMAISGDAFRLNVTKNCHWRGISTFDWSYAFFQTMEHLGWQGKCFGRPGRSTLTPEQQVQVLHIVHDSIDAGLPAIIWNLTINQFGLIYGYDDEAQTIAYRGFRQNTQHYAYNQLGRNNEEPALFVAALKKQAAPPISDTAIISTIISHIKGNEPPLQGFAFGLNGYQMWVESVEKGSLDLLGHAYQVAILAEARQHAVQYLQLLTERSRSNEKRASLALSVQCMNRVVQSIRSLYPSFPFGYGGSYGGQLGRIIKGLKSAVENEADCIFYLEKALGSN
jgi:RNA polymerase sigma factor (sigma-70 family)